MNRFVLFALIAPWVAAAAPAWAYIPPSSFIIKSLAAKRASIKGLRIRSMVTVMDGEKLGTVKFKAITFFNPVTSAIRGYAYDDRNQKLFAIERRPENATAADALLFWHDASQLEIALKTRGLPIRSEGELLALKDEDERRASEVEHLSRWNTSIAWVMGGARESDPSLWIEKDTFLPLRLIAAPLPDADVMDTQFEQQRYYHEFPFPKVTVVSRKKTPLFRDEVIDVVVAQETAEFRATLVPGFTEAGDAAPGALRDLVRRYFEVLR